MTYFQHNSKHYKTAMGSQVSVFCCSRKNGDAKHRGTSPNYLYMNYIITSLVTLRWRHFYFCAMTILTIFTSTLTDKTPTYSLIKEIKEKRKYSFFLDFLVNHVDNRLWLTICIKPTHTHRLTDQWSYNPIPTRPQ